MERRHEHITLLDRDSTDLRIRTLDLIADGVIVVDRGVIVYANRPAEELFDYPPGELVGREIEQLVPTSMRADHRRTRQTFDHQPRDRQMGRTDLDIEGQRADGTRFPIDVKLAPIPGTTAVTATVRDMTHERHVVVDRAIDRLDLATARNRIDRLVASHDLVVQQLFALAAHFRAIAQRSSAKAGPEFDEVSRTLNDLAAVIRVNALDDGILGAVR